MFEMEKLNIKYIRYLLVLISLVVLLMMACWGILSTMDLNPPLIIWQRDIFQTGFRHTNAKGEKVINVCHHSNPKSTATLCEKFEYSTHKKHSEVYNDAFLAYGTCVEENSQESAHNENEKDKIIWITNFIDYRLPKYSGNMGWNLEGVPLADDKSGIPEALEARMFEIIGVLKSNLKHPIIEKVHVMVPDWESVLYLRSLDLPNSSRLVLQFLNETVTMRTQFLYAVRCFEDRIVAIGHQDNMVGAGWDQLQPDILRKNKTFFPITRNPSTTGCAYSSGFSCKQGAGSHDTFLFHAKKDITEDKLKRMETVTPNARGMEHVLIWIFLKDLGYSVVNPCLTLIVHHEHCVPLRENRRRRFYPGLPNYNFYHEWKTPIVNLTVFQNDQLRN